MSTMMASDTTVPLTAAQKMRLASRFLPVIFFILAIIFSLSLLPNIIGKQLPILLPIFLVVVLLVMIYEASKGLRDLMLGVALVEEDELVRVWHSRKGSNTRRYGLFARLGKMRLVGRSYGQAQPGQRCRLVYSPATRIVWSIDT